MPDSFSIWLVDLFLNDATIAQATNGNVYAGFLAGVPNPSYPCVTFSRLPTSRHDPDAPVADYSVQVSGHSRESYDEAFELAESAMLLLRRGNGKDGDRAWETFARSSLIETFDPDGGGIYSVSAIFSVRQIA